MVVTSSRARCQCGALVPEVANTAWCPLCFAPLTDTAAGHLQPPAPSGARAASPGQPTLPASSITSVGPWRDRWAATDLTFGVTGRVIATLLWTAPFYFFIFYAGIPFGLVGAIAFAPVWVRGVRDLWRRADKMTATRSHRRGMQSSQEIETREGPGHPRG